MDSVLFLPCVPVVSQYYEAQVYDVFSIKGNAAVFKCNLPSFVSDHLDVVSWTDTDGGQYLIDNVDYGKLCSCWFWTIKIEFFIIPLGFFLSVCIVLYPSMLLFPEPKINFLLTCSLFGPNCDTF